MFHKEDIMRVLRDTSGRAVHIQGDILYDRLAKIVNANSTADNKNAKISIRQHHYVPRAYQKSFCDERKMIYVCQKDKPNEEQKISSKKVCVDKYYYSQRTPEGISDHNSLEDFFSRYESKWPNIVARLRNKESDNDLLETLLSFIRLQRARVPATRDAHRKMISEKRKMDLWRRGINPESIFGNSDIAVDQQMLITEMLPSIKAMGLILFGMEMKVLHNKTSTPFLTSDNPVIYYNSDLPIDRVRPYIDKEVPVKFLFPIAPDLLILGDKTAQRAHCWPIFLTHEIIENTDCIKKINNLVCRFAYREVLSSQSGFRKLVEKYADASPVVCPQSPGWNVLRQVRYCWGKVPRKDKTEPPI